MSAPRLPDPEFLALSVAVRSLVWCGYRVRCRDQPPGSGRAADWCGAGGRWLLCVQRVPWMGGEQAWGVCLLGHAVRHPLIYPEMVRALIDRQAAVSGADRPDAEQVLADLAWRPHRSQWLAAADPSAESVPLLVYQPWEDPQAGGRDYWARAWPELVAAYALGGHGLPGRG